MRPSCLLLMLPLWRRQETYASTKRRHSLTLSLSLSFLYFRPGQQTNAGWLGAFRYSSPLAQGGAPTNLVMPTELVIQDFARATVSVQIDEEKFYVLY